MAYKKLTASLSIATTVLLQACGSSGSDSGPAPVPNTTAPELVGTWKSNCIVNPTPRSQPDSGTTVTLAAASGGGGGGGGGSTNGLSRIDTITFNQNGRAEFLSEQFSSTICNTNTRLPSSFISSVYFVGSPTLDRNGAQAVELDYNASGTLLYSIFQVSSTVDLKLGEEASSTSGNDGTSSTTRFDGLGPTLTKQ